MRERNDDRHWAAAAGLIAVSLLGVGSVAVSLGALGVLLYLAS